MDFRNTVRSQPATFAKVESTSAQKSGKTVSTLSLSCILQVQAHCQNRAMFLEMESGRIG